MKAGDIPDVAVKMADVQIFAALKENGISVDYTGTASDSVVDPPDINYMLWAASLNYCLEYLTYRGTIVYFPGGISRTKFGQNMYEFMRMQPMFFLGQGLSKLDKVMPFRSYKQIAQTFVENYVRAKLRAVSGSFVTKPVVGWDSSSRGYGWNADVDDYYKYGDSEFDSDLASGL